MKKGKSFLFLTCLFFSSMTVAQVHSLKAGDKVFWGNYIRRVEFLDNQGKVALEDDIFMFRRTLTDIEKITPTVQAHAGFRVGQKVFWGNYIRTIEFLDNTGRVALADDIFMFPQTMTNIEDISPTVEAYGDFYVGQKVLWADYTRTIKYLDNTGRVVLDAASNVFSMTFDTVENISPIVK